jgi:hypothetical protein
MSPGPDTLQHEIQICGILEGAKIVIASEQRKAMIETELCDQCVAKPGAAAFRENLGSQCAGSLPEAQLRLNQGNIQQRLFELKRKFGIAQEFREDRRHHEYLIVSQNPVQQVCVLTLFALEECDPGAGVGGDHDFVN